jgi:hypothetical protein
MGVSGGSGARAPDRRFCLFFGDAGLLGCTTSDRILAVDPVPSPPGTRQDVPVPDPDDRRHPQEGSETTRELPDRAEEPRDVWQAAVAPDGVPGPALDAAADATLPVPYRPAPLVVRRTTSGPASSPVRVLLAGADVTIDVLRTALGSSDPGLRWAGDAVLGAAWSGYRATSRAATALARPAAPVARVVVDPPLLPRSWRPAALVDRAALVWRQQRAQGHQELTRARDVTVPHVVDAAMEPVDLTALVLDDVQLDVLAQAVVSQLDLTEVVLTQVDLERVASAVLDQLDLTAVARDRIDLAELAEEVIDAVDLPEIIRQSTGSVASESVRSVRMQSIRADDRVQDVVDRVLTWRKHRNTAAPAGAAESDDEPVDRP